MLYINIAIYKYIYIQINNIYSMAKDDGKSF